MATVVEGEGVALSDDSFEAFFTRHEPLLRAALVARYGAERGREAAAEALAYAWQEWDRVRAMANPAGYLYRVGQSRTRRWSPRTPQTMAVAATAHGPDVEPGLTAALAALTKRQRTAVALVHGYGLTHAEVADLLGVRRSSVQNHVERAMTKLRATLVVVDD